MDTNKPAGEYPIPMGIAYEVYGLRQTSGWGLASMRTGTKVSIALALFTCSMVFFLIVVVIFLGIWVKALRGFWQYIPETITALLGVNGLAFVAVEARKAVEYRANRMFRQKLNYLEAEVDDPEALDPKIGEYQDD